MHLVHAYCFAVRAPMQRKDIVCEGAGQLGLPEARAAERHPDAEPSGRGALPVQVFDGFKADDSCQKHSDIELQAQLRPCL